MHDVARNFRRQKERLERELEHVKSQIINMESRCQHEWGEAVYDPVRHKAYTVPRREGQGSHPPEPEFHVPAKEDPRWKRTCSKCGKVERTSQMREEKKVTKHPMWPR